jgi:hypothetical protein
MRLLGKALLYFLAIGVALYAAVAYGLFPLGSLVHPAMRAAFQAHSVGIYTHIFASMLALALGPFQFSSNLRQKNISLHRWSGRAYLSIGVFIGGISGLYVAQFAFGGFVSRAGFTLLALGWLFTGLMAYLAIRRRDIQSHRNWMVRSFSLTFAAVTLRIYLGIFSAVGMTFENFYPWLSWLCWVPNLLLAEWLIKSTYNNASRFETMKSAHEGAGNRSGPELRR